MMNRQPAGMKPKGKLVPIFRRLLVYLYAYKKSFFFIVIGFVASTLLSLTPALLVKITLDQFLVPEKSKYLIMAGLAIMIAALCQAVIDFATRYYSEV